MTPQELKFKQHYIDIVVAFKSAFPSIEPPAPTWIQHWLSRYNYIAILESIQALRSHPAHVKARFTQESVGRAISALLRADALKRAIANAPTGVGHE
jgi:hypothetical protein